MLSIKRRIILTEWSSTPETSQLTEWDRETQDAILQYWRARGMQVQECGPGSIRGARGSRLGSLVSCNMADLPTILTVTRLGPDSVLCEMQIDTTMQIITHHNRAYWDLELETFETFLSRRDWQVEKWRRFMKQYRRAAVLWSLSLGLYNAPYGGDPPISHSG